MLPILNPPPSSLPVSSLWVSSVHQPQYSSIMHQTWTLIRLFCFCSLLLSCLVILEINPLSVVLFANISCSDSFWFVLLVGSFAVQNLCVRFHFNVKNVSKIKECQCLNKATTQCNFVIHPSA